MGDLFDTLLSADVADLDRGPGRVPNEWWRKPAPSAERTAAGPGCYRTKTDALNAFREANVNTIQEWGGMDRQDAPTEFEAVNHKYTTDATTLAEALWAALPATSPPYCLEDIDVDALNDTSAGRATPQGFHQPDWLEEARLVEQEVEFHREQGLGAALSLARPGIKSEQVKCPLLQVDDPKARTTEFWDDAFLDVTQCKIRGLSIKKLPDHVRPFAEFMRRQAKRPMSRRDVIKAYVLTVSSVQRGAIHLPGIPGKTRPEDFMGSLLRSDAGQHYLDAAERGELDKQAADEITKKFVPFGLAPTLRKQLKTAVTIADKTDDLNRLRDAAPTKEWDKFIRKNMSGIACAKSGFFSALIGRGDLPTADAKQQEFWLCRTGEWDKKKRVCKSVPKHYVDAFDTDPDDPAVRSIPGRVTCEIRDRLTERLESMNVKMPKKYSPFYQHLVHHAVWDHIGNSETTHQEMIDAMEEQGRGLSEATHMSKAISCSRIVIDDEVNEEGNFDLHARADGALVGEMLVDRESTGLIVGMVDVNDDVKRCGVGTQLYERAAKLACDKDLTLRSDWWRTPASEGFWAKQKKKGRAICVTGSEARSVKLKPNMQWDLDADGKQQPWSCDYYRLKDSCPSSLALAGSPRLPSKTVLLGAGAAGLGVFLWMRRRARRTAGPVLVKPLERSIVTSGWAAPRGHRNGVHRGIDLQAPVGTPVRAIAPGVVLRVDSTDTDNRGRHVYVRHQISGIGQVVARYLHLDQVAELAVDQAIAAGALVGTVGTSGTVSSSAHLHLDLHACGAALASWVARYGTPADGFPPAGHRIKGCVPVPAESIVPVDGYTSSTVRRARVVRVSLAAGPRVVAA